MVRLMSRGSTLNQLVPTLSQDLPVREFGVIGLGEPAMAERRKAEFVPHVSGKGKKSIAEQLI
jgi:hypothetical protein